MLGYMWGDVEWSFTSGELQKKCDGAAESGGARRKVYHGGQEHRAEGEGVGEHLQRGGGLDSP